MASPITRLSSSAATILGKRLIARSRTRTARHQISTSARDAISIPPEYSYIAPYEWCDPVIREYRPPALGWHGRVDKVTEPFHDCILSGDLPSLRELLSAESLQGSKTTRRVTYEKADCSPNGTPLQFAACLGDLAAVDVLLGAGGDPNWAVKDHALVISELRSTAFTPLHLNIVYGHREVAARLWSRMISVPKKKSPADIDEAEQGAPDAGSSLGNCLFLAAHAGHVDIVQDLLSSGYKWSFEAFKAALHIAAEKWNPHVTDALMAWNGDYRPSAFQYALDIALGKACRDKHDRVLQGWYEDLPCSGLDYVNQSALIARLIKAGANPDHTELCGKTLLMTMASMANSTGALKALLENGADPNIISETSGITALSFAAEAVMEYGVDPTVETPKFMWNEAALKLLLEHGASGMIKSSDGTTPLHMAAKTSNSRFLSLIAGADQRPESTTVLPPAALQLENDLGETLLHYACYGGRLDIISMLLDQGLDVNQRTKQGLTPLLCALKICRNWHDPMTAHDNWTTKTTTIAVRAVHLLMSRGAEFRAENNDGRTALYMSCSLPDGDRVPHRGVYNLALQLIQQNKASITSSTSTSTPPTNCHSFSNLKGSDSTNEPWGNVPLLHRAVQQKSLAVVKALLDMGADISATDANGHTANRATREKYKLEKTMLRLLEGRPG